MKTIFDMIYRMYSDKQWRQESEPREAVTTRAQRSSDAKSPEKGKYDSFYITFHY